MKKIFSLLLSITFILVSNSAKSQYYDIGNDPASVKWKLISTEHFRIIFPEEFVKETQRLANQMEKMYIPVSKTLDHQPRKTTIIIHNRSIVANAYAIWAPHRLEYYTAAPQSSYGQDWLEQLSIHELRHIVQMDNLNHGLTKFASYIFGEQVTALVLGFYIPNWFMEGDAVATETALSTTGRGRVPDFEMEVRAQTLDNIRFKYDKATLGSYKDFVPNEYNLGYLMVANTRRIYDSKVFETAARLSGKAPLSIIPFNRGLYKTTGMRKAGLYNRTIKDLDSLWKIQDQQTKTTSFECLSPKNKTYTHYQFPHYINDSTVLCVRSSLSDIDRLVVLKKKTDPSVLHTPRFYNPVSLSVSGIVKNKNSEEPCLSVSSQKIVWAEIQYDKRWEQRSFSNIKILDLKSGKAKKLTNKSRLFAPAIRPDAQQIAAIEITEVNKYSIVILNANDGKEVKRFSLPKNEFIITPDWSEDGKQIVAMYITKEGKGIFVLNTETMEYKVVLTPSVIEKSRPRLRNNFVVFTAAYSGIDNIYALNINSQELFQVTSSRYGANDVSISPDGKKIVYSNYTSNGFEIAECPFKPELWKSIRETPDQSIKLYTSLLKDEMPMQAIESLLKDSVYSSKPYRKITHLFNLHSWAPASLNLTNYNVSPGMTLLSQNHLGTTVTTLNYSYRGQDETQSVSGSVTYKGLYPAFYIDGEKGSHTYKSNDTSDIKKYVYDEDKISVGMYVPLNFSSGKYFRYIAPRVVFEFIHRNPKDSLPEEMFTGDYRAMTYNLYAYNLLRTSKRDVRSRWGQAINVTYRHTPFGGNDFGSVLALQGALYLPSPVRHHAFRIGYDYQKITDWKNGNVFDNIVAYPRGYESEVNQTLQMLSLSYKLPLICPDFNVGSLIYFKRIKMNLFMDYAKGDKFYGSTLNRVYLSYGTEITSDTHFLRLWIPFDVGCRLSYIPEKEKVFPELLFNIDLSSF